MARQLALLSLRGYQVVVSPVLHALAGPGAGCRFHPACSSYAIEAVQRHGLWQGGWLTLRRLARCHPWGGSGEDPVPPSADDTPTTPGISRCSRRSAL